MLSILNTLCHGYVAIPVIQALRRRRLFTAWPLGEAVELSAIADASGANPGYLRIALSMMEALEWVSKDGDVYRRKREVDFDAIPEDICDLYRVAPEMLLHDRSSQLLLSRSLAVFRSRPADSTELSTLLEGAFLLPVLIALRKVAPPEQRSFPQSVVPELRRELEDLFVRKGWGHRNEAGQGVTFSSPGKELVERAYVMAIAVSYRPMLLRMEDLLFGDSAAVFERDEVAGETHVDRQMNVVASGFQHQRYFNDAEHHLLTLFNDLPLAEQPRYIADIGCGDGTFLKGVYEAIRSKTLRGRNLAEHPLLLIGVDYNQAALIETAKTLGDIPHIALHGDIGAPQQIVDDLRKLGIADPENTLYLRSFLDHNFRYKSAPRPEDESSDTFPLLPGSHYVDGKGVAVDGREILEGWRAHLERWAAIGSRHGLVVLESHCLPPAVSHRYFERTESFYFDAVHALSGQYLLDAEVFLILAASVGLFPKEPPVRYPKTLPFCRITLSHLEKRDYVVRHARLRDLDALLEIEEVCWAPELRTSREGLLQRLQLYPQGQFVLELNQKVVGAIYSQRIENEQVLRGASVDNVASLHRDAGPLVQLLAVNVIPSLQGRKLGDELLKFMLQRSSVMNGVDQVIGVTVCKGYGRHKGRMTFSEYVRSRDGASLLDPNLRFHEFHGATIGDVIVGYRPRDVENETRGVLIYYDIFNLKRRTRSSSENLAAEPRPGKRLDVDLDLRQFVEASIRRCLGQHKAAAFAADRPLMEMGLDSADLLELNELLSNKFRLSLEPAFFFEHNSCNRILGYLASRVVVPLLGHEVESLSSAGSPAADVDGDGDPDPIAIVGIAARLPGGISSIEGFWDLLKAGKSAVGPLPKERWRWPEGIDPRSTHPGIDRGGFMERLDAFDAAFFRISPKEAELMDPQQRILLELAWQTIEDAGYSQQSVADTKTGVFIGASGSDYLRLLDGASAPVEAQVGTGNSMAILANRLSYFFDFNGPSLQIDTACSSSLVALHYAVQSLRSGESSQALVGGIHVMCHPANTIAYYKAGMLSHEGNCKTLDSRADGYVRSEGAVMILIKPLKLARADGDSVYALIKGTAINHGGLASGLTVPNPEKQARLLKSAWEASGVSAANISYIEMHGTGTPLGDPIEVQAIQRALSGAGSGECRSCGVGSVKTNLGHLEAAAGLAGLLKVVLCLGHRELTPTVHLGEINRHIHLEGSPLYAVREHQDWRLASFSDRRQAGVSSFGFGGANAHAVLEEYPYPTHSAQNEIRPSLFVLSARTPERLRVYAERYAKWLSVAGPELSLEDLTYTSQAGRQALDSRLAVIVRDKADLIQKLACFCAQSEPAGQYFHNTLRFDVAGNSVIAEAPIDVADLDGIARGWVSGASIPWEVLHRDGNPRRIHLPTYPFAPISHWFRGPDDSASILHPLVQRNSSNSHFTSTFDGSEFFLRDHVVEGRRILPGAAYLEMAREAFEIVSGAIGGSSVLSFKSVVWAQPIQVTYGQKTVHVRLKRTEDDCLRYEIYSDSDASSNQKTVLHGQGIIALEVLASVPRRDIRRLQSDAGRRRLSAREVYDRYRDAGIFYGPAHQGVAEIFFSADQLLARIELPSSVASTRQDYVLHPSIVDAALQAGLALEMIGNPVSTGEGNPLLPFSVEFIEVFAPTTAEMWAVARFSDLEPQNGKDSRSVDVDLCDESGHVCLRLQKLIVRRTPEVPRASASASIMIKPLWTSMRNAARDASIRKGARTLLVGDEVADKPVLSGLFPGATFLEAADWTEGEIARTIAGEEMDHVVWLPADASIQSISDPAVIERQGSGVLRLFTLIKALLSRGSGAREMVWTICTAGTLAVHTNDRVNPTHASIHGLAGCMAKELPNWRVRLMDLESDWRNSLSALLSVPEVPSGNPVAHRGGQWFKREFLPVKNLSADEKLFRQGGVYVVIGGAGGIGQEWSRWLIERYQAQMVWIGRRAKDHSIQSQISALAAIGPTPYYVSADASDAQSLQAAYDDIKTRFPKISGVIHSAIVLKDASLTNMSREQFTASLAANVDVCVRIAQVFDPATLDFVLLFSSIQSFCTFAGQSNYAAGCTFKDAFAERLRQDWPCVVKVVNWGYWGSVGVVATDYYREAMAQKGFGSIEPKAGFELLQQLADSPMGQVAIVTTLREGVVEGLREDEWFAARSAGAASSGRSDSKPQRIPQLTATPDDGGLSLPGLTPILGRVLWSTIQALGFSGRDQALVSSIKEGVDRGGKYQRWVEESLAVLERQNYLVIDGDTAFATDPTLVPLGEVWSEWNAKKTPYYSNPDTRAQVALLDQCLRNLHEILTGKVLSTDVIFASSSPELAGGVYRNNKVADYFNSALATIVRDYLEGRLQKDASFRCRVLEIGAGTGGTTASLISSLSPLRERVEELCFTDISPVFLRRAHEQFDRAWPGLVTRRFDVESPLAEQSMPLGSYDVVVAANVLHATRDIRNTLRNAKAALRPGGLLVLNELSANSLFLHLTFGLLSGWWLPEDSELRIAGCPGLSPDNWRAVLGDEGFQAIAFPAAQAHSFGQQVVVALSDGVIRQRQSSRPAIQRSPDLAPAARVEANRPPHLQSERSIDVPDLMIENRVRTIIRESIAASLKMNEADIQNARVFSDYGVDSIIGVELINQINRQCRTSLPTTALFDYNNVNELSVFVTRRFRTVLVSSLFNGLPDHTITTDDSPVPIGITRPIEADPPGELSCRRLVIHGPGGPRDIGISQSTLPPLRAHDVRIAVRACSLNFADLLCIRGLYPNMPPYPFTPGLEASGVVQDVGASVRSVNVGQPVVAFLGKDLGAHATVITCSEDNIFQKPESLTFDEACSLPAVGVTMVHAFRKAQLRRGERILIQTATGGTGLVAVQLAQHYGAEIYATAGSSEKLDYLRRIGVQHTVNYRETDFATEIARLTDGRGVDVVINTLSGDAIQRGMNCLSAGGRYIEVAMTALKSAKAIDLSAFNNNQSFYSIDLTRLLAEDRQTFISCYDEMIDLASRGVLRPTISHVLPFDRFRDAYEHLELRHNIGKVIVSVPAAKPFASQISSAPEKLEPSVPMHREPIAVIGMSGRFAKSPSVAALWEHLANGDDLVSKVRRWDLENAYAEDLQDTRTACYDGGLLEDIDKFDPSFFDISALEAAHMDPQQRLFLEEAWKALEDAGHAGAATEGTNCGVYVGCTGGDYHRLMPKQPPAHSFWGNAGSVIPARIAYYLNLRGPAVAIDTACSSSLVAIHMACVSLRTQEAGLALAGGVFLQSTADFYLSSNRAGMLSPKGRCHTFDERADGFVPGEGVGVVVLKRLSDAIADGDHIYGVIRASALNQDGKTNGLTAPSANSQERLERQVYESFSIRPDCIQMVEAHGTGTRLGDPIEFGALTQAFRQDTQRREFCSIGSIKANLGHTATAAGVAGVLKVLLSLQHKKIPPSLHFGIANPAIRFPDSPFYVNTKLKDWDVADGAVRCAAVSSFGFSGTNAHMVLEDAPAIQRHHAPRPAFLIVLSARTSEQLNQQAEQLLGFCDEHPDVDIGNMSFTLLVGRRHSSHRLATIVQNRQELAGHLRKWLDTGHVLQVQVSELEDKRREDPSLAEFGNDCIRICRNSSENSLYLARLATIATLFTQGYRLEFAELFAQSGYSRIALPTYPFSRERYWVKAEDAGKQPAFKPIRPSATLHPLVQQNCSTSDSPAYRSEFRGDEFFLADHQLNGKRLMPAVAYLEMAVAAANHSRGGHNSSTRIQLKNVVWPVPLTVREQGVAVLIRLTPREGTAIDFTITNDDTLEPGSRFIYCQGTLETSDFKSVAPVDLSVIQKIDLTTRVLGARESYDAFQALGIAYGPSHRGLESISISGERAIARLFLPAIAESTAGDYVLHPSVMDAALQATIAFFKQAPGLQLPYAVEQVTVHRPSERRMWAIVQRGNGAGSVPGTTKLDVDICNDDGDVCVALKGLTLRDVERDSRKVVEASEGCLFFQPLLEPKPVSPAAESSDYSQRHLVLCNVEPLQESALERSGIKAKVLYLRPGPSDGIEAYFNTCVTSLLEVVQEILQSRTTGRKLLQIVIVGHGGRLAFEPLSALAAVIRTVRQEDPSIIAQLIEVEPSETEATIVEKIIENGKCPQDQVVVYTSRQRRVTAWKEMPSPPAKQALPWKENGIYLITGGAGGLGRIFLREISRSAAGATVILIGRSALPPGRLAEMEEDLQDTGVSVHYRQVDVGQESSMTALATWIGESIGELNGVLHCAGLTRDNFCLRKTNEEIREVLAPKVAGLLNLDQVTCHMPLDFFVCFSSVAGAMGNVGQADYAAANAFMDAFAHYRSGLVAAGSRRGRTLSINWPLWQEGARIAGETADQLFRTFGMSAIPTATGIQAFYQCYATDCSQVLVLSGDNDRIRQVVQSRSTEAAESPAPGRETPSKSFQSKVVDYLRQVIASVLDLPVQRVKETDSFERYGIDSILALKLTNELEQAFGSLSKILFFEHQNIRSLADYLIHNHGAALSRAVGDEAASGNTGVSPTPFASSSQTQIEPESKPVNPARSIMGLDIAIVGVAGRYPGARTIDEFWDNLKIGRDCVSEIPADRWNYHRYFNADRTKPGTIYSKWGGFIDGVDEFDPLFFGVSPREAELMDPQERLFLQCAYETLEDAGYVPATAGGPVDTGRPANVGVFVGVMYEEYQLFGVEETMKGRPIALSGNPAAIANRVSYFCNFDGPSMVVDTMCSSSLTAIHLACQSLRMGECSAAIAGGVNVSIHPNKYLLLSQGKFASSVGRCESFGRGGDGYVPGEGVGAVLLKPLTAAVRDGDHIYGVIKGTALNHGGKTNGFTVPNPNAQASMIGRAIRQAGVHPRAISYVEAHGTGTSLGDPIEIAGLTQAFREGTADRQYCAIGSLKSNIGHCESAAGIGGMTKVLVQLQYKQLVPSLHSRTLNPLIDFDETPFRVQQELGDWNQTGGEPRIAGISSFGAGGSNAHVVVQEYPENVDQAPQSGQDVVIVLSARTRKALESVVTNLRDFLKRASTGSRPPSLAGIAYTLQVGRVPMEERLAFTVKSVQELEQKLQAILDSPAEVVGVFRGNIQTADSAISMMRDDGGLSEVVSRWMQEHRLDRLSQVWVSGVEIEWNALHGERKPQRVGLPTYPFERERYWVPGSEKPSGASTGAAESSVMLTKDWRPSLIPDHESGLEGTLVVLGTPKTTGFAARLFKESTAIAVIEVVHTAAAEAAISTDYYSLAAGEALYRQIEEARGSRKLLGVVDCTALDSDYGQQPSQELGKLRFLQLLIEHQAREGFKLLQVVSRLYPFGSSRTSLQGARLAGLYRMINAEYRNVQSVVMDVDLGVSEGTALAAMVQREFLNQVPTGAGECCYRKGIRYEPVLITANEFVHRPEDGLALERIATDGVFMVTGGTRGIGAAVTQHLVARGVRRLVLLGREELPSPENWQSLAKADVPAALKQKLELLLSLTGKGVQVRYFNTSLTDSSGLHEMLRRIHAELGLVTAVFHCAGIVGSSPAFVRKTIAEIEAVCEPKVQGVIELHRALVNEPLKFFVLFSSVSSVIPSLSVGQGDYAMANAFMDFYALHQASQGQKIFRSIQWPAWSEAGQAVGKMDIPSYTRTGLTTLGTAEGLRLLESILNSEFTVALPAVMKPVDFEYSDFLNTGFAGRPLGQETGKERVTVPNPRGSTALSEGTRTTIVAWLKEIFMSELKLSADHFRETRRFDEYGVDSVMVAQLVQIIQKRVSATLPPSLLLEYTSVADLADYFSKNHTGDFANLTVQPSVESKEPRDLDDRLPAPQILGGKRAERGSTEDDIAVVGISCRFPGASSKEEYWKELVGGDCAIKPMTDARWKATDEKAFCGGWLEDIDCFDPSCFNLSVHDAAIMDPQARLLLEESLFALHDAGYDPKGIVGEKVGVYIGGRSRSSVDMNAVLKAPNPILGVGQNYLATNISRFFNFGGPSVVVDTACSSAITSMVFASDALRAGRIQMAMVGGVSLLLTPDAHRLFAERNILNESGEFRIFDRQGGGEVLGEGVGMVILRRLQDAIADGNHVYGVIKAISTNNDGRTLGPGSPNIHAQKQVMTEALRSSGIRPEDVGYIEVNGGGSPVVDAVEIRALSEAYLLDDSTLPACFLGSVKPNVGHLLLASGLAGFIRCVLSVYHKQIPPFLSAMDPFEYYDFSTSRISFNRVAVPWDVVPGGRRIAAQSSYPDGGTNSHVLIEEFAGGGLYRQELFPQPKPLLNRTRFPLSLVSSPKNSVAYVTRMTKADVMGAGMANFLNTFDDTGSENGSRGGRDETVEEGGSIQTAWGEYDEESI